MLVSKNPHDVAARQNLTLKNPHFALKTGEKFPQTSRLKSLIFITEKYGKKLLFNFLDKNHTTIYAFAPAGRNVCRLFTPLRVASLCVGLLQAAPAGRGWRCIPQFFHDDVMAVFAITFSGGNDIVLFLLTLGLKVQKHLARGRAVSVAPS